MTQWDDPQNRETTALPQQNYGSQPYGTPQPGERPQDQPRARYVDSTANPFGAASDAEFGIVAAVMGLLGGVLGVVTLTGLEWFGGGIDFGEVGDIIDGHPNTSTGFASAYFSWLAWAFLIVAVLAAVMSSFPSPALRAFRIIGTVVGFAAAGLSFLAVQYLDGSYAHYLKQARIGFYLCVIAFLLAGIGAAIGPRKV